MKRFIDNGGEPHTAVIAVIIQRPERSKLCQIPESRIELSSEFSRQGIYIPDSIFIT